MHKPFFLALCSVRVAAVVLRGVQRHEVDQEQHVLRVKAFYITGANADPTELEEQLRGEAESLSATGGSLQYEPFAEIPLSCSDGLSCLKEKPECFHTSAVGLRSDGVQMGTDDFVAWCSQIMLLKHIADHPSSDADYVLVLQKGAKLIGGLRDGYHQVLSKFPGHDWTLVSLGTHSTCEKSEIEQNMISPQMHSISPIRGAYLGGQGWLIRVERVARLVRHLTSLPASALDEALKMPHPMHLAMWAYQHGAVSDSGATTLATAGVLHPVGLRQLPDTGVSQTRDKPREVLIFGMYNTGSKVITDLIRDNLAWPSRVKLCKNYTAWGYCGRIWKHTHPDRVAELAQLRQCSDPGCEDYEDLRETVAVVIVRHPFSLIRSVQVHHYDLQCTTTDSQSFAEVDLPCHYKEPADWWMHWDQKGMPRLRAAPCASPDSNPCWGSIPEAWNSYIAGVKRLRNYFHDVVLVRYEDVDEYPRLSLLPIADAVGVPRPDAVKTTDRAMGWPQNNANGREGSLQKLSLPDYGANFTCLEMSKICAKLDRQALFELGYHGCQHSWPGYRELLQGQLDTSALELSLLRTATLPCSASS